MAERCPRGARPGALPRLGGAVLATQDGPKVAQRLAFRGGTALGKLVFEEPARYSEDIDLVQLEAGPITDTSRAIHGCLDGWLGSPSTRLGPSSAKMIYRFDSEFDPPGRRRLKIEINTREHQAVLGIRAVRFAVASPWFEGGADITTYPVEELLGTKLRALYQRKKGRDLFDLAHALEQVHPVADEVVSCFLRYMEQGRTPVSRAEYEANLWAKAKDPAFTGDARPLLAEGILWDVDAAVKTVSRELIAKIPGDPWRGP